MKKIKKSIMGLLIGLIALLVGSVAGLLIVPQPTQTASAASESDFTFTLLDDGTYSVKASHYLTGSITIPSSYNNKPVTKIPVNAFHTCDITSFTIPETITSLERGSLVVSGNRKLGNITVDSRNPNFCSIDGVLFNKNVTELMMYPYEKAGETYTIPSSVTTIGSMAFYGQKHLTTITIPDNVTTVDMGAFEECRLLTNVTMGNKVESIGSYAFENCRFEKITIPVSVKNIGTKAFYGCSRLAEMYYEGTSAEWNAITKGTDVIPSKVNVILGK